MDISSLSTKKAGKVKHKYQFVHPVTQEPLAHDEKPAYAIIVSEDSKDYSRSISRLVNDDRAKGKSGGSKYSHSAEKIKKANHIAACTRRLVFFEKGQWVDISSEDLDDVAQVVAIRDAYLEYRWMVDQLDLEIVNEENFLGKLEESSVSM